jgi:hypothetical protein
VGVGGEVGGAVGAARAVVRRAGPRNVSCAGSGFFASKRKAARGLSSKSALWRRVVQIR